MPKLHYTALPPDLLEQALTERSEVIARPQRTPRQVLGMWMENAGAGIGVGGVVGVGLYFAGAPEGVLLSGVAAGSIVVWGALMAWRGSADERAMLLSERKVRKAWKLLERDFDARAQRSQAQLERALDALDEADATEAQLRRSLDEMARQRDRAVYDLAREREQAGQRNGRSTFVAPAELAPQDIRDATEMIRFRYDTGEHLSRRKAADAKGWSERQWDAAKANLDAAAVIRIIKGQTEYPQTLDEALGIFGEYMLHVRNLSVPTVNKTAGRALYVESEEG